MRLSLGSTFYFGKVMSISKNLQQTAISIDAIPAPRLIADFGHKDLAVKSKIKFKRKRCVDIVPQATAGILDGGRRNINENLMLVAN